MNATPRLPSIVIAATGGTIAGRGATSVSTGSYRAGVVPIEDIIAEVPELAAVAHIRPHQIMNLPSKNMNDAHMIEIGKTVARLAMTDADGIVVTHGTDTIEETAYFLNLTVKTAKPIVMVGAMRPSTSMSADGPLNLYDAIRVAANKDSFGKGVLLVMNGEIHSARDVAKTNTFKADAFASPYGPLGHVTESHELYYRSPARLHTLTSAFDIADIDVLPNVQILYCHANVGDMAVKAFINGSVEGIVVAGTGNANLPDAIVPSLQLASERGIHVVRASRTGSGSTLRREDSNDLVNGWIVTDDQTPQKARLLLALGLMRSRKASALQAYFVAY